MQLGDSEWPDCSLSQRVEFFVDNVRVEAVIFQLPDELGVAQERELVLVLLNTAHQHITALLSTA